MINKILLILCVVGICNISIAQMSNETLGTTSDENGTIYTTGNSITTGSYNVMIGDGSGSSVTDGESNTLVGTSSGAKLTTGDYNVFLGDLAGFNSDIERDNVFIGFMSGYYNNRSDNVFIGRAAGFNNTDGDDGVFIGDNAGLRNTTGDDNTYIGNMAGPSAFSNPSRTFNGQTNVPATGSYNTAVGERAGFQLTTGFRNTFIGRNAGYDNTTGYRNTFVGDSTGVDISTGRLNTFVGQAAGNATEKASYNTFIGTYAGGDNERVSGTNVSNRNTYVGTFAGFSNRHGEDNAGFGAFADYTSNYDIINITGWDGGGFTSTTRSRTTFMGAQAYPNNNDVVAVGYKARVDGVYGIAIGSESRAQGTYSVAVGRNVDVSQANTMALGGGEASNRLSVGIGTVAANPNASLDLADIDKGLLVNRVTTAQRVTMMTTPASGVALTTTDAGLMVYDTDDNLFYFWNGTQWNELGKTTTGSGVSAVPELLNYQSVVRGVAGDVLANQSVSFRLNVIDVTTSSATVYSETHNVTTSEQGVVNFEIGNGTIVSGAFSSIDWSHNNALEVELDVAGGTTYVAMGTTSFVSVPYALRAKYAENLTSDVQAKTNDLKSKDGEIEQLKKELKELKTLVEQLIKK